MHIIYILNIHMLLKFAIKSITWASICKAMKSFWKACEKWYAFQTIFTCFAYDLKAYMRTTRKRLNTLELRQNWWLRKSELWISHSLMLIYSVAPFQANNYFQLWRISLGNKGLLTLINDEKIAILEYDFWDTVTPVMRLCTRRP